MFSSKKISLSLLFLFCLVQNAVFSMIEDGTFVIDGSRHIDYPGKIKDTDGSEQLNLESIEQKTRDSIVTIKIQDCPKIKNIVGLESLKNITSIELINLPVITELVFGATPTLKRIYLKNLQSLERLTLRANTNSAGTETSLTNLESLLLENLEKLEELSLVELHKLKSLHLSGLIRLESLELKRLRSLEALPDVPNTVTVLRIGDCEKLENFSLLSDLPLRLLVLHNLPSLDISSFPDLSTRANLSIRGNIHTLYPAISPKLPPQETESKTPDSAMILSKIRNDGTLEIDGSRHIDYPGKIENTDGSEYLDLEKFSADEKALITTVDIKNCPKIKNIVGLESLKNVENITLFNTAISEFGGSRSFKEKSMDTTGACPSTMCKLKHLKFTKLDKLERLSLAAMENITLIELIDLPVITGLIFGDTPTLKSIYLKNLQSLESLDLKTNPNLDSGTEESLTNLESLHLENLDKLTELSLRDLYRLKNLHLSGLIRLESLELKRLRSLEALPDVPNTVTNLRIGGCEKFKNFGVLKNLPLKILVLQNLPSLDISSFPDLSTRANLSIGGNIRTLHPTISSKLPPLKATTPEESSTWKSFLTRIKNLVSWSS